VGKFCFDGIFGANVFELSIFCVFTGRCVNFKAGVRFSDQKMEKFENFLDIFWINMMFLKLDWRFISKKRKNLYFFCDIIDLFGWIFDALLCFVV
jgi:hypothetical protein